MSRTDADLKDESQLTSDFNRRSLVCLLIPLAIAYVLQIGHGLPNQDVTWHADGDPMVPLVFAEKAILDGWNTGWHTASPDFHRFVLLLIQGPYMVAQKMAGNLDGFDMEAGYPYDIQDFDSVFMHLALITRMVSVLMALGSVFFVMKTSRALFPNNSPVFAGIILGFAPSIVYFVHTETLDVPMLFWISAAFYCYVRAIQTFQLRYYLWLAIFAAVSIATKDYAYGVFVLMPFPLVFALAKHAYEINAKGLLKSVADKRHLYALGMFVLAFILAENLIWNPSGFMNHVKLVLGMESPDGVVDSTVVPTSLASAEGIEQLAKVMPFCLGWINIPICLMGIGLIALWNRRECLLILVPFVSYYLFTISLCSSGFHSAEQSHLPLVFFLAIFGGQALALLWGGQGSPGFKRSCVVAVLMLIALNGFAVDLLLAFDTRYQCEQWFADNVEDDAFIEAYGYRSQCPRLSTNWVNVIVNQREAPDECDLQVTTMDHFDKLGERNPRFIVVPQAYALAWRENGKKQGFPLQDAFLDFFSELEAGTMGYIERERFLPFFSSLVGLSQNQRHIPEIVVYEKIEKS